ncbi:serine/threonine protein kinase [Streptomyces spinoverrucosus]|uniref:Serine/threonine protein kinase n=1 Tax=Streptomyces spinoverrucosus TaxID=284043 RepID=A0A4Y3VXW8_9ACTN|nr:PQQ-binding-like beta-propeller repeat protein [Streptomyces spinoverrucosus]GEC09866.1 serine/threonine protein kinase [Streptomyces spinoverrucosus]GHB45231.1 serine/threonine protein kinase [Streptomyces spinoverrucosus]
MQALRETDPRRIGPYEVRGRLGAGGMGEVYLAEARGGLRLAVKVVRAEHAEDRTFRARFRQEVRAAQTVGGTGTYTARVVDADTEAERPWMATEFVDGPNLRDAVLDHGPLPEDAVLVLAAALGEALAAIHAKGMVHRDLKPSNILLAQDGPRVIDFGIVRALEATSLTRTGTIVGSVGYVSPEQIRNGAEVGPASDVFSLGAVLAYAASGREPFGEGQDSVILLRILTRDFDLSAVPKGVLPLVESCLRAEPQERPTPQALVAEAGHTGGSLRDSTRPGWLPFTPERAGDDERWLPDRDSGPERSRVEYLAPHTVVSEARPGADVPQSAPSGRGSSRRRLLTSAAGGLLAAGVAVGGVYLTRERDAGGDAGGSPSGTPAPGDGVSAAPASVVWQFETGPLFYAAGSGPCVALAPNDDVVYAAGEDGTLWAINSDGTLLWKVDFDGLTPTPPAVTADGVFCALTAELPGSERLVAVSHGGDRLWARDLPSRSFEMPAVTEEGLVLVGYGDLGAGGVRAYAVDGTLSWTRTLAGAPDVAPVVVDGTVYVGCYDDHLYALDATTGDVAWRTELDSDVAQPGVSVTQGMVVASTNNDANILYGITTDGKRVWQRPGQGGAIYSSAFTFGSLALARVGTTLVASSLKDGARMWTYGPCHSDPAPTAGAVLLRSGGELHAVAADGTLRWKVTVGDPGERRLSPVVRGTRVYVPSAKGLAAVNVTG